MPGPVLVMGVGSIGGWLGGRLLAAGARVHRVGRPRMLAALAAPGLTLTDRDGGRLQLPAASLQLHGAVPSDLAATGAPLLAAAELPLARHANLASVQWGKLLLNLNNAVNALSGLPLRAQLLDRDLRCCTAALIAETLAVLRRAGIAPAAMWPLPPARLPAVLRLPTPLFRSAAARLRRIDSQARSSRADDLALGRPTEVEAINGEVLRLAARCGMPAPCNTRITALVQGWPQRPQPMTGAALRHTLGL